MNINEIGHKWRFAGANAFGGSDYVEIDIHNNNFRSSDKASEATVFRSIMYGKNERRYIRHDKKTYWID